MRTSRLWVLAISISVVVPVVVGAVRWSLDAPPPQLAAQPIAVAPAPPAEPVFYGPELPPSKPSNEIPTLVEAGRDRVDRRVKALASELDKMWTRNPEELVSVIDEASRNAVTSPSVTLLLAIAHAETNGKILDVSEAGAVGLAQATPVAYRQEKFDGPLFVTSDYLIGARAYIMKKPLGDADTIASILVEKDTPKRRARAKRLLESAKELRREGVEELDLLEPYAAERYFTAIRKADKHNAAVLKELEKLLDKGEKKQLKAFRDRTRREYRALKQTQLAAWRSYQLELAAKRDKMLEERFGLDAKTIKKTMPYEAGEYLGEQLDERFSAKHMADFLVRHLETKAAEARKLARENDDTEELTAALYNGGSHNVKRMLAGLIGSLPETQRYMKKVPATRRRLDSVVVEAR